MVFNRFKYYFYELVEVIRTHSTPRRANLLAVTVLVVIAFIYDRSFYNYPLTFLADEGSVALISEKLFKGEKPYIDIEPGYGLLWFLPIVCLFMAFGIKFYLIRIYFLGIACVTALFAYGLILHLTTNRLIAFSVALLVLLFPGCIIQTYIPFLVISGLYILLLYDIRSLKPRVKPWLALSCNGVFLSIAYFIRGDIATIFTLLFLFYQGLFVLRATINERRLSNLMIFPIRGIGVAFVVVLIALPFALKAMADGYLEGFLHQYSYFAEQLVFKIQQRFFIDATNGGPVAGALLPRPSLESIFHGDRRGFSFITYAPVFAFFSIALFLVVDFFRERLTIKRVSDFISERTYLIILLIGAFSTFPQFFVWRPDISHLSGFMPGFVTLMAYFLFILGNNLGRPNKFIATRRLLFFFAISFSALYVLKFADNYDDGPYHLRGRDSHLRLEKGIDVFLNQREFQLINELNSTIRENSRPDEFVLCFPYCPGINFIADRPTFLKYLYVDDSYLISKPNWVKEMRDEILVKKPPVIVIKDWAINETEISRFQNWAKPVYDYVSQMYERKLDISGFEVFVLK